LRDHIGEELPSGETSRLANYSQELVCVLPAIWTYNALSFEVPAPSFERIVGYPEVAD
jgi:hypothetical protein